MRKNAAQGDREVFRNLKAGDAFQFQRNGSVFIKCRGGFRPGQGGQLHACQPHVAVITYNPLSPTAFQE